MEILICDDNIQEAEKLEELCEAILKKENMKGSIEIVSGFSFSRKAPDLLLLDIEMPEWNGIDIKEQLEKRFWHTLIIFVTYHDESMCEAFGKNVIGFLKKPVDSDKLQLLLKKTANMLDLSKTIELNESIIVSSKEIYYIVFDRSYSDVYIKGKRVTVRRSMKQWETILPESFLRINNSCIVNCEYIENMDNQQVVIVTDCGTERMKLSRRRKKDCAEKYQVYCRKMAKYV